MSRETDESFYLGVGFMGLLIGLLFYLTVGLFSLPLKIYKWCNISVEKRARIWTGFILFLVSIPIVFYESLKIPTNLFPLVLIIYLCCLFVSILSFWGSFKLYNSPSTYAKAVLVIPLSTILLSFCGVVMLFIACHFYEGGFDDFWELFWFIICLPYGLIYLFVYPRYVYTHYKYKKFLEASLVVFSLIEDVKEDLCLNNERYKDLTEVEMEMIWSDERIIEYIKSHPEKYNSEIPYIDEFLSYLNR